MKLILQARRLTLIVLLVLFAFSAFAQTPGLIYQPATTAGGAPLTVNPLNPSKNGYTSATIAGFQGGIDYGAQSELKMIPIPRVEDEPVADLSTGASGGHTDIVGGSNSVYVLNDGTNLIVRFRVGKNSSASKGYTLLIDTDEMFGPSDPSYTTTNMGFEKEVTLATNFSVKVYDLVANTSTNYTLYDHHQRSIAATNYNGDPDYFYDFYVPISAITATPSTTKMRFAATSVTSAQSGTTGTISDINGIVDNNYGGNIFGALNTAITSFPATTLNDMAEGNTFAATLSLAPVITSSIATNSVTITGTSTEANGTTIKLYRKVGVAAYALVTSSPTVNAGTWTWTITGLAPALATGDLFYATATAAGKGESLASNIVEVTGTQTCYTEPPIIITRSNGQKTLSGTWSTGTLVTANSIRIRLFQQNADKTFTEINGGTNTYVGTDNNWTFAIGGTGNINTGVFFATATVVSTSCQSGYSNLSKGTETETTVPEITTTTIAASAGATNIDVKNLFNGSVNLVIYINGVEQAPRSSVVAFNETATFSLSGLIAGDIISARAQPTAASTYLSNSSNTVIVTAAGATASTAPVITGNYYTNSTTVSGTSVEQAGSTITLYKAGSTVLGTTTVNNFGNWTVTGLTLALNDALTAKVSALGKSLSNASNTVTVLAAATNPTAPIVTGPIEAGATSISGTSGSGTVTVYVDGTSIGTVLLVNGAWTLSGIANTEIFKGAVIHATNTNTTSLLTSVNSNTVIATGVDNFLIEAAAGGNIGTQTAGVSFPVKITARNSSNVTFTNYIGKNVVASGSAMESGAGPTASFTSGVLSSHDLTLTTAGTYTLITVSTADPTVSGTSNTFVINPGPANKLAINTQPSATATNEVYFATQPVIYIQDQYGNLRSSDNTTQVTVSKASGSGTLNGQLTVTAVNGIATFSGLSITGTGAHTLSFAAAGLIGATSNSITVSAGAPDPITSLTYETPKVYVANNIIPSLSPTVTGTVTNYSIAPALPTGLSINPGTGVISGTPTAPTAQADYTVTASNTGGIRTFDITITVNSLNATKLAITTEPSATAQSGVAFSQQPAIQLKDGSDANVLQAGITITASIATGGGTLGGTVTAITDANGLATFSGLMITGTIGNRTLQFTSTSLDPATSNTIALSAGAAAAIRVETAADGSGTVVSAQNLTSGSTLTGYSITRDAAGNFVANAAGTWSLTNKTVGVADGNLVAAGDNKSAVMTGVLIGTANISATSGGLTATSSGTITVIAGAAAAIRVETAANGSGTVVSAQNLTSGSTLTGYSITRDAAGNFVANAAGNWSLTNKTGGVADGNLVAAGDNKSAVMTGVLIGSANILATSGGLTATNSGTITVIAGASAAIRVETAADGSGTVVSTQNLTSGSTLTGYSITRDAAGNFVANAAGTWSLTNKTDGVADGNLIASGDNKSAVMTGFLIGTANILATSGGLTATSSGTITVIAGAAAAIRVETAANGSGTVVSAQNLTSGSTLTGYSITRDAAGNFVANAAGTWSLTNKTGGVIDGNLAPAGDNKSAVMTGVLIGTANILATSGGLTATSSGTITVIAGTVTKLSITTQPASLTQTGVLFAQQPVIQLQDVAGNPVNQAEREITVSVLTGAGVLGGTLTLTTNTSGITSFTDLMITGIAGDRTLQFSSAGLTGAISGTVSISLTAVPLSVSVQVQVNVGINGQNTGSITLSGNGGTAPYQYSKDGMTFQSSATFGSLAAGTYTFTIKDNAGATSNVSVIITQPAILTVAIQSKTDVIINGHSTGSLTLSGSGGTGPFTYSKDGITFQSSAIFGSLAAGTYTFTIKDNAGATSNVSVIITQPAILTVAIQSKTDVTINGHSTGSLTLSGSGGTGPFTYSKDGITFQSSAIFGSLAAGTYTFTIKDNAGATSNVSVIITQPASLTVAIQSKTDVTINGHSTGSVTLSGSGGTGPFTYSKDGTNFQSSATFSGLTAGTSVFTIKDAAGAVAIISIEITQPPALVAIVSSNHSPTSNGQNTGSVTLSAIGGVGPYQYSKDGITFQPSATFGSLSVGDYIFYVKDAAGVVYMLNKTMAYANGSPTDITLATVSLYENRPSGELSGRLSSSSAQSGTTFTYTLVSGSGDTDNSKFSIINDELRTSQVLDYESKSRYSVRVRSTTQHGFSLEKEFTIDLIDVNEAPTLNAIANQTLCYTSAGQVIALSGISAGPESGQSTTLTVSSNNPGLFQSLAVVGSEIRYTVALNQIGLATVTVRVQDNGGTANGGVDEFSRTFTIQVNALPEVAIVSSLGTSISKGATTLLSATGGSSYQWSTASGIISGQNSPVLTVRPLQGTTYTVSVTNASGCVTSQNITVQVVEDYAKLLPTNNFSPNGDGINDVWVVENLDAYPDHKLTIFDRGGRILYTVRNYNNTWDGRVNGALLDEGTYFYVFEFSKPGISPKKGFITIVH